MNLAEIFFSFMAVHKYSISFLARLVSEQSTFARWLLRLNSVSPYERNLCTDKNNYSDSLRTAINLSPEMVILLSASLCSECGAKRAVGWLQSACRLLLRRNDLVDRV